MPSVSVLWWYPIVGVSFIGAALEVMFVKSRQEPDGLAAEFQTERGDLNVVALKRVIR